MRSVTNIPLCFLHVLPDFYNNLKLSSLSKSFLTCSTLIPYLMLVTFTNVSYIPQFPMLITLLNVSHTPQC